MEASEVEAIKVGDRVRFKVATRTDHRRVWRVVTAIQLGRVEILGRKRIGVCVRYHGWGQFQLRNHEIEEHEAKGE
jgi:hypothetical protein